MLAGHEAPRRWAEPVPLVDVLRAASSEIEQYERIVLDVQPDVAVVGAGVADTVHLLAELLENATTFSAKTTKVTASGHRLTGGGAVIEITDHGMGIPGQVLAELNDRLANPPVADVAVSRHMGLFAVAHLAARHSIRCELHSSATGGTVAQVRMPASLISREAAATGGGSGPARACGWPRRVGRSTCRAGSRPARCRIPRCSPRRWIRRRWTRRRWTSATLTAASAGTGPMAARPALT